MNATKSVTVTQPRRGPKASLSEALLRHRPPGYRASGEPLVRIAPLREVHRPTRRGTTTPTQAAHQRPTERPTERYIERYLARYEKAIHHIINHPALRLDQKRAIIERHIERLYERSEHYHEIGPIYKGTAAAHAEEKLHHALSKVISQK